MILIKWFTAADCSLTAQKATALNLFPNFGPHSLYTKTARAMLIAD
jgi:hypothetical protein